MGAVLEMRRALVCLCLAAAALSGCGNDSAGNDLSSPGKAILGLLKGSGRPPASAISDANDPVVKAGILAYRTRLEAEGQPILLASIASLKYGTLHAPFGQNGDVQTWSSTGYQTMSLRGGVLIATRGFGPDLMASMAPDVARIAAASGSINRRFQYLDGADQPQSLDYSCTLASGGTESIEVMAKPIATRKVTETCTGASGSFTNEYWFDHGLNIRQSSQHFAPGVSNLFMQRVVD
jgi:predicted small secreted protein